jgi:hypothetical protein
VKAAHDVIVLSIELAAATASWLLVVALWRRLFVADESTDGYNLFDPPLPDGEIRNPTPEEIRRAYEERAATRP